MKPRTGERDWMTGAGRTWRWNEGTYDERGSYDAVEASPTGLSWYRWSHAHGDGGAFDKVHQSFDAFATDGPLRDMPARLSDELRAWIAAHRSAR